MKEFEFGEKQQAAGYLHDTVEDTGTKERELIRIFGRQITSMVMAVTTPSSIGNRKARLLEACGMPLKDIIRIGSMNESGYRSGTGPWVGKKTSRRMIQAVLDYLGSNRGPAAQQALSEVQYDF